MEKERENIVREVLEEEKGEEREKGRVCVTGAEGFLGSWLVKLLLSKGYKVHATVRDPSNGKNSHLKSFKEAPENLQLFQVELLDYDALSAAISGCEGVFHAATPIPSAKVPNPEIIQIDVVTLKEGLPPWKSGHAFYLEWSVHSFRTTVYDVNDTTQPLVIS